MRKLRKLRTYCWIRIYPCYNKGKLVNGVVELYTADEGWASDLAAFIRNTTAHWIYSVVQR